jgi:hypothetical protein
MLQNFRKYKNVLFAVLLGAALAAIPMNLSLGADHEGDCRKRIHVAEERLRKAIDKHGEHSPEADRSRHELERARNGCEDVR